MNLLLTFNYKKLSIGKSVGVGFATVGLAERFFVSFSNYSLTKIHIRTTHTSHILGNGSKILIPSSNVLNPLFKSSSHTVLGGVPAIRDLRCMTRRMNYPVELVMGKYFLINFFRYLLIENNPFAELYWGSLDKNLITIENMKHLLYKIIEKIINRYK